MPSRVIQNDTPYHRVFIEKLNNTILRTFGCAYWPNLHPYNSHKLQFHSKRCIFLGYNTLHKGYKCLDPSTGRIYTSSDVTFDEQVFPFSSMMRKAGPTLKVEISLHATLFPISSIGGSTIRDSMDNSPNASNHICSSCDDMQQPQ
jgi:hypothetical protein